MPQLSILLPFYNATATFDRAVDSIVNQTFRDWELLLVDNGSTDKGSLLAEKWRQQDARIILTSCAQRGIAHALNHGLSSIDSPYVARMDADDWSHPTRLEKQVVFLNERQEIGVGGCQTTFESTSKNSEGYEHFVDWQNSIISSNDHFTNRFKESPIAHPAVMFRRELIDQYGAYSTEPIPEDYELWLKWMDSGVRFAKIPEKLLTWYDEPSRLSRIHSNYSEEAFFKVKGQNLANWMERNVNPDKKVVACGTSKECRQRARWLMDQGVRIDYLTDVVPRSPRDFEFLRYQKINSPRDYFVLNLIGQRGVGQEVEKLLSGVDFVPGRDYLSLA
ncbi:MAG: glycosyltransferase [Cyclobacteriaceae bacterium]